MQDDKVTKMSAFISKVICSNHYDNDYLQLC